MTDQPNAPAGAQTVWDLPLRLFHWIAVSAVAVSLVTGYLLGDHWLFLHVAAGGVLGGLLAFRLAWGVIGSRYSRFATFPLRPSGVRRQIGHLMRGRSDLHTGHNPVGAWMIVALLAGLGLLVATGLVVWGGQEHQGPLSAVIGYKLGHGVKEVHEVLAALLLTAVGIHVAGVVVETVVFRHPVVKAMVHGRKPVPGSGETARTVGLTHTVVGLGLMALAVGAWLTWFYLPRPAVAPVRTSQAYTRDCGDCHWAFHPSLRTAGTWRTMMAGLADHYGEDASLAPDRRDQVTAYLVAHAAETADTEASHEIGRRETASGRITDTRYWQRRHRQLSDQDFARPDVGSKMACNACHRDADTGRFDDDMIQPPKGVPA